MKNNGIKTWEYNGNVSWEYTEGWLRYNSCFIVENKIGDLHNEIFHYLKL